MIVKVEVAQEEGRVVAQPAQHGLGPAVAVLLWLQSRISGPHPPKPADRGSLPHCRALISPRNWLWSQRVGTAGAVLVKPQITKCSFVTYTNFHRPEIQKRNITGVHTTQS